MRGKQEEREKDTCQEVNVLLAAAGLRIRPTASCGASGADCVKGVTRGLTESLNKSSTCREREWSSQEAAEEHLREERPCFSQTTKGSVLSWVKN